MIFLTLSIVSALAFAVLCHFIAVVVGVRQAHPTDLALPPRTYLEALTRRILGLSVRRDGHEPQAGSTTGSHRVAR